MPEVTEVALFGNEGRPELRDGGSGSDTDSDSEGSVPDLEEGDKAGGDAMQGTHPVS